MKKAKKFLIGGVIAVIVLVAAALLGIDRIARVGVETAGTYALGVQTTLGSMDVGLLSGRVGMSALDVANPEGFTSPHFLRMDDGRVAVTLGSLMSDRVEVPELTLSGIDMSLERKQGRSNYQTILDGLKKFESAEAAPKPAAKQESGKKFVIAQAVISDVTVTVDMLGIGGGSTSMPVKIERIELKDIGSDSAGGVQLAELSAILTKAILAAVVSKAGGVLPAEITGELSAGLDGLRSLGGSAVTVVGNVTATVGGEVKQLGTAGKDLLEGVGTTGSEAGRKVGEGLKGLLPGKKKEDEKKEP